MEHKIETSQPKLSGEGDFAYFQRMEQLIMDTYKDSGNPSDILCPFVGCDRRYTSKYSLFRHYLIHNPKKEHLCSFCGKKFSLI